MLPDRPATYFGNQKKIYTKGNLKMKDNRLPVSPEIVPVSAYSKEIHQALESLLLQLTPAKINFSCSDLKRMIESENVVLIIARETRPGGKIIGTLSYAFYRIPTGLNFRIEDVVVDHSARGRGVGRELMHYAIRKAKAMKADKIDLTSSPERTAANRLYQSLGFVVKKTNVYRYDP
jgi:ribosomal protein S18 acetylase RimI-like enzyme